MGYEKANGRYARTQDVTLQASAVKTTSFTSTALELGDKSTIRLDSTVTAASGTTPSVTVTIETSKDGATNWTTVAAFSAQTGVGTLHKVFTGLDRFVRVNAAISGTTPSFTMSVTGEAA